MQLLVFLEVFLKVEGLSTGCVGAAERLLLDVLVLHVMLTTREAHGYHSRLTKYANQMYVWFLACDHTAGHSYTCPYFHTTHIEVLATGEDLFTAVKRTQQYFFWVCFPVGGKCWFSVNSVHTFWWVQGSTGIWNPSKMDLENLFYSNHLESGDGVWNKTLSIPRATCLQEFHTYDRLMLN